MIRRLNYNYQIGTIPKHTNKILLTSNILFIPPEFRFYVNINEWWCKHYFPYCYSFEKGKIYLKILNNNFGLNKSVTYLFIFPNLIVEYYSEIVDKKSKTINKITFQPNLNVFR